MTLTGTHVTAWSREAAGWVARARHDLREVASSTGPQVDTRDEAALAGMRVELPVGGGTAGGSASWGCATSASSPPRTAARCGTTARCG